VSILIRTLGRPRTIQAAVCSSCLISTLRGRRRGGSGSFLVAQSRYRLRREHGGQLAPATVMDRPDLRRANAADSALVSPT
jgi:hypothetical protein